MSERNIQQIADSGEVKLNYIRGYDREDPNHTGVVTYDEDTRTMTQTPTHDGYFQLWAGRKKYIYTAARSIVWPDVSGIYYFYTTTDGVLHVSLDTDVTAALFLVSAIDGLVTYNATTKKCIVMATDELHGVDVSPTLHLRLHLRDGCVNLSGCQHTGLVDNSTAWGTITAGMSMDEDIFLPSVEETKRPFIYRVGDANEWVETVPMSTVGYMGSSYLYWNKLDGGIWGLHESDSSTDYVIYYDLFTNDSRYPIKTLVGQQAYSSRGNARDGLEKELTNVKLEGLPGKEVYAIDAYIVKRDGKLEDDGDGNTHVDLKGTFPVSK